MKATKINPASAPARSGTPLAIPIAQRLPQSRLAVRSTADDSVRQHIDWALRQQGVHPETETTWIATTDAEQVRSAAATVRSALVNLAQVNNLRRINTFLRVVNSCLPQDGIYICRMETLSQRWERVLRKYSRPVAYLFYLLTFVLGRVFPKLPVTKQIYFALTGGKNRVLSEAEALGRLVCCGFSITALLPIEGSLYIVARKVAVTAPALNPSYGPLFRAPRIGRGGKEIRVFKLRTMHPYSEYLQEYVYERNNLAAGGKFKNDFRVTGWGRICRRYWLDELPMLFNWLKGELKLVGVRPLSPHYASLYPEALRTRRQKHKPGLLPPFYADLPTTFEGVLASEEAYLARYEQQPLRTDLHYFCWAMYNILFRHARSA